MRVPGSSGTRGGAYAGAEALAPDGEGGLSAELAHAARQLEEAAAIDQSLVALAERLAALATTEGPRHLGEDFELVRETFHRFAEEKVRPHAEHVHRTNADIPEEKFKLPEK